jgi:photosystem II stability/assembly factor-like uncharacterized protein
MKATLSAFLFLVLATASFAGWSSSGPTGGAMLAVAVAPSDPNVIWAGNSAGVFRSTDGSATWTNVSGPVIDVRFLAVHPTDPNRAWALTGALFSARLYRTLDGGATWIDSTDGLPGIRPTALLVDPRNPDTLYIGSACGVIFSAPLWHETAGVFRSTDGGATWNAVGGLSGISTCAEELSLDPFSPWRLFIAGPFSDIAGYSESYDAANSFTRSKDPRPGLGVVFDPRFPFTHYGISARLGDYFFVSQDGGFTWSRMPGQLPASPTSISMDPERSRIFLGTRNGVYRSGNGGRSWAKTLAPDTPVVSIAFGGWPRALFAASAEGLLRMENHGMGAARRIELNDISSNVFGLAVDPSDPNVAYASTRTALTYAVSQSRAVVFRTTNAGASWEPLADENNAPKADYLTVDGGGTIYGASYSTSSIYRRGRNETKWTQVHGNLYAVDIEADPKTAGTVFVYGSSGLQRTRDAGKTWTQVLQTSGPGHIAIDPSDARKVYLGTEYELYGSTDGGDTWTTLVGVTAFDGTRAIVVAPSDGRVIYRIASNVGQPRPARSNDGGATWTLIPLPSNASATTIAVDPRNANSVWAGADGTLYHSADGGATWLKEKGPFASPATPLALRFDPTGRVLHVVFPQHGVWELTVE